MVQISLSLGMVEVFLTALASAVFTVGISTYIRSKKKKLGALRALKHEVSGHKQTLDEIYMYSENDLDHIIEEDDLEFHHRIFRLSTNVYDWIENKDAFHSLNQGLKNDIIDYYGYIEGTNCQIEELIDWKLFRALYDDPEIIEQKKFNILGLLYYHALFLRPDLFDPDKEKMGEIFDRMDSNDDNPVRNYFLKGEEMSEGDFSDLEGKIDNKIRKSLWSRIF